jgi:hypothetical protein
MNVRYRKGKDLVVRSVGWNVMSLFSETTAVGTPNLVHTVVKVVRCNTHSPIRLYKEQLYHFIFEETTRKTNT